MKAPEFKYAPPAIPFKLYDEPLKMLIEFYKEHIWRDIDGAKLAPAEFWVVLRGLLISAAQTYTAVCLLLSERQPKRLMLQAAILNRSLLETLGNVLALSEAPKSRTRILVREAYKNMAIMFIRNQAKYGSNAKWKEYLDVSAKGLDFFAKGLRISRRYIRSPNLISEQWPTPGRMVHGDKRRKQPPFLRGNRRKVFQLLYDSHYGHQSEQAHQRAAAVSAALIVDESAHWNPGLGESSLVSDTILFLTCIISELESEGRYSAHPRLLELWVYLKQLNVEAEELWRLRYRSLLHA